MTPAIANRIVEYGVKPADQFQANPANWRVHPQAQRDALAGVLESVGWAAPVIENKRTGNLIDGHERVWQAQQAGNLDVPYVLVDVSENEERTLLTTLDPIGALAETDRDKLAELIADVRSDDNRVQELIAGIAERENIILPDETGHVPLDDVPPEIDRAAELQKEWGTERGQVWTCGNHRVMCGDSTSAEDVATLMDGKKAEMVWTDPPYGVAIGDKNKYLNSIARSNRIEENLTNDTLDEPSLVDMLCKAFDNSISHCLAGAAWYVAAPAGPLHVLFGQVLKDRGIWHQTIQWVKNNATFSPMGVDYHWRAEPIFYGWVPGAAHRYYGGRKQDTVWEIDRPIASPEHPTMKPIELVARAVENSSLEGLIVHDPFLGSGSTLIAAEQTGRVCYGMEISPAYVAVTLQRYKDVTGNTPVLA